MNYYNIYNSLCNRAKNRIKDLNQYYEKHHILPKSLGGLNTADNLVYLTGREHFICHWLLTKVTVDSDYHKMLNAWTRMAFSKSKGQDRYVPSSKVYEILRKKLSIIKKGKPLAETTKQKLRKPRSEETKQKMRSSWTKERRQCKSKMTSGKENPNFGNTWTNDQKLSSSIKMKGRYVGEKNPMFGKQSEQVSGEKNPMFGKTHSDLTKMKMRKPHLKRKI